MFFDLLARHSLSHFLNLLKMAKVSKPLPVQTEMFHDPLTASQLLELVNDKLTILEFAIGQLRTTASNLAAMADTGSNLTYNYEFFSPTTVDTKLQLKLLV